MEKGKGKIDTTHACTYTHILFIYILFKQQDFQIRNSMFFRGEFPKHPYYQNHLGYFMKKKKKNRLMDLTAIRLDSVTLNYRVYILDIIYRIDPINAHRIYILKALLLMSMMSWVWLPEESQANQVTLLVGCRSVTLRYMGAQLISISHEGSCKNSIDLQITQLSNLLVPFP